MLLAAKVLVISRLLHTKLAKRPNPPPYLESLKNRLASLRRKLLARIDRCFKSITYSKDALIGAMCAFSLATSSSPTDVVRHFHHLRLEAMSEHMNGPSGHHKDMLIALQLYVKTLKDTQSIVPLQFSHALEILKAVSLFKGQDLHGLVEMNLDIHERWIGDDITNFTPYIRHDDLSKAEAEKLLKLWAKRAVTTFLDGLHRRIQDVEDPVRLMLLRQEVLELWLSQHQHSLGIDTAEILDGLRDVFNNQAIRLIRLRSLALDRVDLSIQDSIKGWREGVTDVLLSLWDPSITPTDTARGGKGFRKSVMNVSTGKNDILERATTSYMAWLETIETIEEAIQALRKTKWADNVDEMDDDDDLLDNKQMLLSEDDPRLLQEELSKALKESFAKLQESLRITSLELDTVNDGRRAAFLLRVWREVREKQPQSYRNYDLGLGSIPDLQRLVALAALRAPLETCSMRFSKAAWSKQLAARPLWEGEPDLPVLPSPWAYRLLREVVQSMANFGSDIWSPQTTATLKEVLIERLAQTLEKPTGVSVQVNGHTNGEGHGGKANSSSVKPEHEGDGENCHNNNEDGEAKAQEGENGPERDVAQEDEQKADGTHIENHADETTNHVLLNGDTPTAGPPSRDHTIQTLFDALYLSHATVTKSSFPQTTSSGPTSPELNALGKLMNELQAQVGLNAEEVGRMRRAAGEYWKRSGLLFGLLL